MWAPRFLLYPNTCTPLHTSAWPVSFGLTLALYLATTCGQFQNTRHIHECGSSNNQLYETIWSLKEEEIVDMVDAPRAARANVNSVWIMAFLMKTCGKHYCRGPAPFDSPIRCRGSEGHSCS